MDGSLSIVIPLFNEDEVLPDLLSRVESSIRTIIVPSIELIFVDDGSTDRTFDILKDYALKNSHVSVVSFSRNFGHQAALTAGLDFASGDSVVFMDGDLQDPPELISELIAKRSLGFDVVYVRRESREGNVLLRASYYLFYRIVNLLSNVPIARDSGDFFLISRRAADALRAMPERHRFIRGMRSWVGFSQTSVTHHRSVRLKGRAKYSLRKLCALALDGTFSFSIAPLRVATVVGAFGLLATSGLIVYWLISRMFYLNVPSGFAAGMTVMLFLSAVQFLLIGIIGEYVGRIYEEVKNRPNYIVRETITTRQEVTPAL